MWKYRLVKLAIFTIISLSGTVSRRWMTVSTNYGKRLNDGFLIVAAISSIKLNKPLFNGETGTACRFYENWHAVCL